MDSNSISLIDQPSNPEAPNIAISVCLTNYNRSELLFSAVSDVLMDRRVSEIIISDDCSRDEIYQSVVWYFKEHPKVKIYRNETNLDCYHNKARSLELATNDWCCLWDSDNIFGRDYIDRIENLFISGINEHTAYAPSFARPHFNFEQFAGVNISKSNISGLVQHDKITTMLNAMNYFVNRHEYLKVFDPSIRPVTSDSIYHNSRWLEAGNSIYIVPGLQYEHRVSNHGNEEPSHYGKNVRATPIGLHESILDKLKSMR